MRRYQALDGQWEAADELELAWQPGQLNLLKIPQDYQAGGQNGKTKNLPGRVVGQAGEGVCGVGFTIHQTASGDREQGCEDWWVD